MFNKLIQRATRQAARSFGAERGATGSADFAYLFVDPITNPELGRACRRTGRGDVHPADLQNLV